MEVLEALWRDIVRPLLWYVSQIYTDHVIILLLLIIGFLFRILKNKISTNFNKNLSELFRS
jgi:uncharacterized protein involved in cysteine biosynthesis